MIGPASTAQEGWSPNEQLLYLAMWQPPRYPSRTEVCKPITGMIPVLTYQNDGKSRERHTVCGNVEVQAGEAKRVTGGIAVWMARTGMGRWAIKSALRGLLKKGDIKFTVPPRGPTTPTTYIVFSFDYIVKARAAADLLYYERPKKCTKIRLVTTQEAQERWAKGEPVKLRPEHLHSDLPATPEPPAPALPAAAEADAPPQPVTRPKQKARLNPDEYLLVHAALDGVEPSNVTAEADLVEADRAANPGIAIRATALKIRLLVAQYRASGGSIRYPIGWMLKRIGSITVDMEAEEAKEKARAEDVAREAAGLKRRQEAAEEAEALWQSIEPQARAEGEAAWASVLEKVQPSVPSQSYETWLKPTRGAWLREQTTNIDGAEMCMKTLCVEVPSPEFSHIGEKYRKLIRDALNALGLEDCELFLDSRGQESRRGAFGPIGARELSP